MESSPPPSTPDPTPQAKAKKPRTRKPKPPPAPSANGTPTAAAPADSRGRLGSDLHQRPVDWLLQPWFAKGALSLVIGLPEVGKSTYLAWLTSQSPRACILPGFEEEVEVSTLARLRANGVNLKLVRFLDDRPYTLPRDKGRIASIVSGWEAELLTIDPIDSYLDEELSENNGRDVRTMLESAAWIARETGCAVVCVRHPGKDLRNILPGSRQWRAVPRSIIQLASDGQKPAKTLIRHIKNSFGPKGPPRQYRLLLNGTQPPRFMLEGHVDVTHDELAEVANDPGSRRKVVEAAKLIKHMFEQEERPAVQDLVGQCRMLGIGEHARDEAKRLLGIVATPLESGGKWVMFRRQKEWPTWLTNEEAKN